MNQNQSRRQKTTAITQAAIIAALYIVLTFLANAFGLANYAIQIRFSESLTILPYFIKTAIPGLFIGCLLSNILTGCAIPDIVFGSLATLIGAVTVTIGELLSCGVLGMLLLFALEKHRHVLFAQKK